MSVMVLPAAMALEKLAKFDAVIDARSEAEYAEDRLPGAINWPSLNDAERHEVGTLYKQVSPFDARKLGAGLVAANIARHIARGNRRQAQGLAAAGVLLARRPAQQLAGAGAGQIGFRVNLLEGGYKAFRQAVLASMPDLVQRLQYRVVCGPTGSGKTRLLQALEAAGAQVLDLEALASHRSSVLGLIPGQPQPTQKRFDTLVWEKLRSFDPARPVYVESESKKVGNLAVPDVLMTAMRASPCLRLELSDDERVRLLLEDYAFFATDTDLFCERLDALVQLRGHAQVEAWQKQVQPGTSRPWCASCW
jgi:tRNA 2-selenouridine synthase